jgi:hypothetical protein
MPARIVGAGKLCRRAASFANRRVHSVDDESSVVRSFRERLHLGERDDYTFRPARGDRILSILSLIGKNSVAWLTFLLAVPAFAGPPSDTLLPNTTKGYVAVARPAEFKERWLKTQWGQMANDEVMQPFVEDLRKQLEDEYNALEDKLGIAWDDLEGVSGGELSLALIERKDRDAALAITIDVTDHQRQAEGLLAAAHKRFAARNGSKQTVKAGGVTLHVFAVPGSGGAAPQTTVYFINDNVLVGVDDRALADAMVKRFAGNASDNLASIVAYKEVMARCARESKDLKPEARWFVEPFGCIYAARTLDKKRTTQPGDQDFVKILQDTGFDAIKGVGGYVNQLVNNQVEFMHRTCVYAPPVNANDALRWTESMRMLQLPNTSGFDPQSFVPRDTAGYRTFSIRILDAFDNLGPLVDAIKDHEGAWANSLEGWKNDLYGPKVDVRSEMIAHLGERVTLFTGYDVPISVESERSLIAVETTNENALRAAFEKWMKSEPDFKRHQIGPYIVWERVPPKADIEDLEIDVPGFTPLGADEEEQAAAEEDERERVLPNSAVTIALGHLMMASDIDYLGEILGGFGQRDRLASSADYQQVVSVLDHQMPGERSVLEFGRSDEELRPIFELIRQGKMPESKSILGKLLNKVLTTEKEREDGVLRKQQIDGSSLPSFEAVRRYFGPHGGVVRSENDGWTMTGVVLNKEAP